MNHLCLLFVFFGFTAFYLFDVVSKSMRPENLLLILPVSVLIFLLIIAETIQEVRVHAAKTSADTRAGNRKAVGQIGLLLIYPILMLVLKFDGATVVFSFLSALWLGERNLLKAGLFASVFGIAVTALMNLALPIEVPTLLEHILG